MKQRSLVLLVLVFLALAASACAALPPVLVAPTPIGGQAPERLLRPRLFRRLPRLKPNCPPAPI